jgi:hypothetical protein
MDSDMRETLSLLCSVMKRYIGVCYHSDGLILNCIFDLAHVKHITTINITTINSVTKVPKDQ